jgi:hypothetical protein
MTTSPADVSTLTSQELSRLLLTPHMTPSVSRTFERYPTSTAILCHYTFLSQSIVTLEQELERHQLEREQIFDRLMQNGMFRRKIQPIVTNYRPMVPRRTRFHPQSYTSQSPSQDSSSPPLYGSVALSQSIDMLPGEARNSTPLVMASTANPQESYRNPIDEEPGSSENPIVVRDEEDPCTRCKQQGHQHEDCGTPMRSFQDCEVCAWTRQAQCTHIDVSPAWFKELKTNFEKKNN